MGEQGFDYYYGDERSQFSFYRIPRQLITGARFKKLSTDAKLLYGLLLDRMGLSARSHDRILRVARTIADLDGAEAIAPDHLAEAIQYRNTDILKG